LSGEAGIDNFDEEASIVETDEEEGLRPPPIVKINYESDMRSAQLSQQLASHSATLSVERQHQIAHAAAQQEKSRPFEGAGLKS
jgi:hypothetical protein